MLAVPTRPAETTYPKIKMPRRVACTFRDTAHCRKCLRCPPASMPTSEHTNRKIKMLRMVACRVKETVLWCKCLCAHQQPNPKSHAWLLAPFWTKSCGASVCAARQREPQTQKTKRQAWLLAKSCRASVCAAHPRETQTQKTKCHACLHRSRHNPAV